MKSPANPYIGPRAFLENERLYGRDRELADLMDLLIAERIALLYSPSGAGKSSLVQAGLIPAMKARGFAVGRVIRVNAAPPPGSPVGSPVGSMENRYTASMIASLQPDSPPGTLHEVLNAGAHGQLLVFDQFEEILTTDPLNVEAKRRFFEEIGEVLRSRSRWALFSMREDFLAGLDPYLRYIPTRLSNTFRLGLLSYESSLEAIREPASKAGVKFLDEAVQQIADDLRKVNVPKPDGSVAVELGEFIEPVQLQVVCLRRWEDLPEGSKEIARSPQPQIGSTALSDFYSDSVVKAAAESGAGERTIRDWFEDRLITKLGTRGQVMMGPQESEGLSNKAIKPLMNAYLVRSDQRLGSVWLELAHDRLIEPVRSSNRAWRKANLSPLQRTAELWNQQGRPSEQLLGPESVAAAEQWAKSNQLNPVEKDFLKASREAVQAVEAEKDLRSARAARNRIFFDLLSKVVKFPIESVLNGDSAPGEVKPADPAAWVTLIGAPGKAPFAIARAFGDHGEGRVLLVGHERILTNMDAEGKNVFLEVAMTWLRGEKDSSVILSAKPTDTLLLYAGPQFNKALLQKVFANWGYQVETVVDLSDRGKLEKAGVVVIGNSWGDFSSQEIDALTDFVNQGGGLLALGLGWSWRDYGPRGQLNKPPGQPIENYPMNRLCEKFGAGWTVELAR